MRVYSVEMSLMLWSYWCRWRCDCHCCGCLLLTPSSRILAATTCSLQVFSRRRPFLASNSSGGHNRRRRPAVHSPPREEAGCLPPACRAAASIASARFYAVEVLLDCAGVPAHDELVRSGDPLSPVTAPHGEAVVARDLYIPGLLDKNPRAAPRVTAWRSGCEGAPVLQEPQLGAA
jgi:hypothetical protein